MHTEKAPRARGFLVKNMPTWRGVEVSSAEMPRCRVEVRR